MRPHRNGSIQMRGSNKEKQMRIRLAQEAARILVESGGQDFLNAKRKAALRLGAVDTRNMPSNTEIEQALMEYQRLFRGSSQPQVLRALRNEAVRAMGFFEDFRPKLVGPVLQGTADEHSPITLHIFAATVEEVGLFLMRFQIPYQMQDRRLRLSCDTQESYPCYRFMAGRFQLEVIVFLLGKPVSPLSPVDGRPMRRASLAEVRALLDAGDQLPI